MGKEVDELNTLLKKARFYIEKGDFDKSVLMYSDVRNRFERLPKKLKTEKLVKDVNIFYEELSLHLRLNEAYILASEGNFKRLKDVLDHIYNLELDLRDVQSASSLLKAAEKSRKNHLRFYRVKSVDKKFEDVYKLIEKLIKKREWNSVYREYAHLLMLYNKIIINIPSKKDKLYARLNKLIKDINIYKSLHKSYDKKIKKKIRLKRKKKEVKKKEVKKKKQPIIRIKKMSYSEKKKFRNVRKAIGEGDLEKASHLLEL